MPIHASPAQDPRAFIGVVPNVVAVGAPPDDRYGIEADAHPPDPQADAAGYGPHGGYVQLRICGPRGGWLYMAGAGSISLSADDALTLAARLASLAQGPIGATLRLDYDPAVERIDRYAISAGSLRGSLDPSGRVILTIIPNDHRRARLASASIDRGDALVFATAVGNAAGVARGVRSALASLL